MLHRLEYPGNASRSLNALCHAALIEDIELLRIEVDGSAREGNFKLLERDVAYVLDKEFLQFFCCGEGKDG